MKKKIRKVRRPYTIDTEPNNWIKFTFPETSRLLLMMTHLMRVGVFLYDHVVALILTEITFQR